MTKQFHSELISWAAVHNLAHELALKIRHSDFRPDVVVAIARGGYIPARLLCDFLDLTDLSSIRIVHYTAGANKKPEAQLVEQIGRDLDGKTVLLVDDVSDTGDTLEVAFDHLAEHGAGTIRSAVLQHKQTSSVLPDFYARKITKWRWIIYPWAIMEDLTGFMACMPRPPGDAREAVRFLEQNYGLRIRQSLMEKILQLHND